MNALQYECKATIDLKYLLLLAISLLINVGTYAFSDGEEAKFISQALTISEPVVENNSSEKDKKVIINSESEVAQVKNTTKIDSSYYSVNKFNFVFYLMYKLKYSESENTNLLKKDLEIRKE